jgi:hypothetical protein
MFCMSVLVLIAYSHIIFQVRTIVGAFLYNEYWNCSPKPFGSYVHHPHQLKTPTLFQYIGILY